jgi:hypothetical protein
VRRSGCYQGILNFQLATWRRDCGMLAAQRSNRRGFARRSPWGKAMHDAITVESDLFEHRQVKPHFINRCCFGEDFATWLKGELSPLTASGFVFSDAIQEDYGWGFWASHARDRFWIALSYVGDGPQEAPGQWVVSIDMSRNVMKRLFFFRPNPQAFADLRDRVWQTIAANPAIKRIDA